MEFLRSRIRRTKLGELAYLAINASLPVVLLLLIYWFNSPWPALALVFISKWRIFALRPRFWLVNVKANAVDLLVGMSAVGLLFYSMSSLPLALAVTIGYGAWLLYLKPRSGVSSLLTQAGIAQFVSLMVLFRFSTEINEFLLLIGCFVIGYSVARHVLSGYEEDSIEFLSHLWGLILVQLGWILNHWTIVYDIGLPLQVPMIALITLVVSFAVARLYNASKTGQMTDTLVRATAIFSISLLAIILIFARWDVTI